MPDNNKQPTVREQARLGILPFAPNHNNNKADTGESLGESGVIASSFGETSFGDSQYDEDRTFTEDIKSKEFEYLRGERQGWGAETANAIGGGLAKVPFTVIGNVASMLDFEDYYNIDNEVGNAVTAWAEEVKGDIEEATKIYKSNDNTLGSREWWMNNAKGLFDSAGAFALTGAGLGKGVQLLSELAKGSRIIQGIGTVTNAAMLNQAESIPIAMGVYQKSYDIESAKYTTQLEEGLITPEEVDQKAKQAAADAAAYSININRINIPLNLTSAGAFLRPIALTRQVAKDASKKQILGKLLSEGSQEYVEENVNMIAENEAIRSAKEGNKYTYDFNNTVNEILSKEGFETGIVGFLGGLTQTGLTDAIAVFQKDSPSYDEDGNIRLNEDGSPVLVNTYQSQKERFKAQQKSINSIEILSKSESVPTIKETLDKVKTTATILNDIQEAAMNNDEFKVSELQNDLLINQSVDAFKNGTTEQLIDLYKSITNDPSSKEKFGEDYRIKAQEAIKEIENLEKVYQKHSVLPQVAEIVANKAKVNHNIKQSEALRQEIINSQINQQREMEVTGFNTPEQIATLSSTKDLQELKAKEELIKNNVIALTEEYNKIISPEYTQAFTNKKLDDVVAKESAIEDNFKEPVVTTPVETPVTSTSVESTFEVSEGQPASEEQIISYLGDKIINRKGDEIFTPEEQQIYDNFKDKVEEYIASKANVNSQPAGYADIALDYLFTGGKDTILSTDYLLQALVGGFPKAANEINNIRNKYADKLGNIKDDINFDVYNQAIQEIKDVINKKYNNPKALEIFNKILKNPTGFTTREGRQVNIELDNLNESTNVVEETITLTPEIDSKDVGVIETLSNGASNAFDESSNQDEVLDKSNQIADKEFTSKKPNALMMLHYLFKQGKKVWQRDSNGLVEEEINPSVSIKVSNSNVAVEGSEVTYVHHGDEITILQNANTEQELVIGKLALPHETTSTDPKVLASLEELKKIRAYILSKPSGSIKTTVAVKGKGKLLTKIQHNLPVLDQPMSSRPEDMIDGKPLFLYDNGESLVGKDLNTNQNTVANTFAGTSFAVENVNDPLASKLGVGKVYQAVKTANGSWSVIPVFTEFIGKTQNSDTVVNTILDTLVNNISDDGFSINYNKVIQDLNKYIFISSGNKFKNNNGIKIFESKEKTEQGKLSVAGTTFKFSDLKSGNPVIIQEFKTALQSARFNLDVNNLNKTEYQRELMNNGVLVTNAYTDSNNNYYVQPYIELNNPEGYTIENKLIKNESLNIPKLTQDISFQPAQFTTIGFDSNSNSWIMKIDEDANIGGESKFEKNGWTYTYAPWMDDEQQYSRYKFVNSNVKSENLSKETYYAEKGNLDDNPFSVKQISFEEAKQYWEDFQESQIVIKTFNGSVTENNVTETKSVEIDRNVDHSFDEGLGFSRTKLEGKPVDKKSIAILEKILPGITLADAKQVEEVGKNLKDTYGMFHNMLIYLFNGATNQTMYHEAFHGVFRNILSDNERSQVLAEAINKYDKPTAERLQFLREGRGNLKLSEEVLTQLHYEERLSDDFGKYADGEFNKSLGQTILDFFKKIFNLFNIFKNSNVSQTEKLFSEITKGKFAKRSIDAKLANLPLNYKDFGQAYVRAMGIKDNTPLSYELERTKSISDNILDAISQEVSKGTPLTKVDVGVIIQSIKDKYLEVYNTSPEGSVKTMAGRVYLDFDAILENVKKQIWATRKIKLPNVITKDSKIEDSEGVQDTKDTEITSDMEGNETKGWKEMTSISGIKTATHEIKLFLSNIPVIKKDGKVDTDAYGFNKFHSFEEIYHTLENTLIGTTTFEEQTKVLKSLAPYKPVLQQILDSIEDIKNVEIRAKFKQQFAANFNKQVLNYKLVTYKKVGDNFEFKMLDPNRQGVELNLKTKWESSNIIDPNNLATNDIRTFNVEEGVYEVNPDKVKQLITSYQGKDLDTRGVFDLANKLGIGLSYSSIEAFEKIPSLNKYTPLQNLTRDLLSYANNKWVNKRFPDARKVFNELVKLETNAQTALFTSSFNNVENSTVYAVQYQSYASKLINKLSNDVLGYELKQEFERDPMFKNNFLFKNRHNLQMFAMDGLKMEGDTAEGKKFNQIDSDDYTAMIINMFVNKLGESNKQEQAPALYAPIIPAEKGLSFGFSYDKLTVPENLEGSTFLQEYRQLFLNELARIKQVTKDIRDNAESPEKLVNNYHLGKKLGLQFNLTNAIDSKLKAELDEFLADKLDSNEDLLTALSKTNLLKKVDDALIQELEHVAKTEKQILLDKNIIQEVDGKLVSDKISSTIAANTIDKIVREWSLNSYLFNISSSLLINGDPAFYKGPADNGKRFYQGYSMLKFADTSVIDQSYKFIQGGKMKINVISDVEVATESKEALFELSKLANNPKIQELADAEYNKPKSINATDAQMFVSVDLYNELQKLFGQESDKLSVLKPFYYNNQWNTKTKRYEPVQVKCSVFPLTDEYVANNPLLAEHKKLMDESSSYPQVIAFESTMKALSPYRANISTPESTSVVELDLSSFGEQVANPDHMLDSHNSSLRQLKMLFYGMVENEVMYGEKLGKDIKAEIALLDKANIEEALQKVVKGFSTNDPALTKMIQEAITSRNATSIIEKVFQQNPDGTFQYPLDLISSSSTIQLISSIFSGNVTRQSFVGGSAVQVSAIGLQAGPSISKEDIAKDPLLNKIRTSLKYIAKDPNNDHSIDYCEAAAPVWMKEFLNEDGTVKDNIPEKMKQLLVYRIPTEGAHSMMAVKVVHFLPNDYKGVMLLPYEVTKQFGADFDFDKIFFIARDSRIVNGEIKPYEYIADESKVEERYFIYRELNKDSAVTLEEFRKLPVIEQNVKPARDNKLLDNYMQILRSVNMLESLITPSGPGGIADIAEELERKSTKKKSNNYFTALNQVALKDLFHKISRLKGIAALQVSGHAWATEGNLNIKPKQTQSGWSQQGVKIFDGSKTITRNNLNQVISDDKTKIVEELSAMMAVILDAVKTPEMLPSIGITEKTLPLWSYITRLGLGTHTASRITAQPAIKDLSAALESNDKQLKSKGFTKKTIETVLGDYNKIYTTEFDKVMARAEAKSTSQEYYELKYKFLNKATSKDVMQYDTINLDELKQFTGLTLDNLNDPKAFEEIKLTNSPVGYKTLPEYKKLKFLQLQISLLNMYANNEKIIAELGQLNNLFSINKETGPNFEDVNGKLEIYKTLTSENTLIDGIGELLNSNAIKPYIDTVQAEFNVLENHYNFASNFFNGVKNEVARQVYGKSDVDFTRLKSEDRNTINGFIQMYLDAETTFKDIYTDENRVSEKDFMDDMAMLTSSNIHKDAVFKIFGKQIPVAVQEKLKSMTVFQLLHVENIKNSNERFVSLKGNGKIELHQKELLINDLLTLWNEPSGVYKPLIKRLVEHSFINTGLFTGLNSYSSYIDPSILQDLGLTENRVKVRPTLKSEFISKDRVDLIVDQIIRNNAKKFTKTYDNEKQLFSLLDDGKTLVVDVDANDSRLTELIGGDIYVSYIRFKLNKDFTPIYKIDKEISKLNKQITYRQVTYLGQPGKRLEINPFGEVLTDFPNNKYEKMEIKVKETKPKNLIPTPKVESEDFADNSESLYEGYNEVKPTEQDTVEESIDLETTNNNTNLAEDPKFNEWYGSELEKNPDISLEEALEYYKKCKL